MKFFTTLLFIFLFCQFSIAQKKWGHKSGKYSEGGPNEYRNNPLTTFDKTKSLNDNIYLIKFNIMKFFTILLLVLLCRFIYLSNDNRWAFGSNRKIGERVGRSFWLLASGCWQK